MNDAKGQPGSGTSNWSLVRRLFALSWRYRGGCIRVLVFQVALLAIGLSGLGLTGLGIDFVQSQVTANAPAPRWPFHWVPPSNWKPMAVLGLIAGSILALAILRAALNVLYSWAAAQLIERDMVAHLRSQVYDKLQRLSFRFFDANASGSIINRVTGDSRAVVTFVNGVLLQGVIMVLSLAVYLTYMVFIHWKLTLACLATTPILWLGTRMFSRKVRPEYERNRELFDKMVLNVSENVQGMPVVKGFARENQEIAKFGAANRAVRDQQHSIFRKVSAFIPCIGFLTEFNLVVLLIYGGYLVIQGQLPLGTGLIVFVGLLQQFSGQVSNIANIANTVQQSLTGARRVFEVLDAPVEIQSPANAVHLPAPRGQLRFEHVHFAYKTGDAVLHDIAFEVKPGQCVAIFGATGAGKSTLLSLVPRFYDPTAGRVLIDGRDVRDLDLDDLRRHIGLVFQESFLFSNTVEANIAFGHPEATREQVEEAARTAAAHEFIVGLPAGYDTVLGEFGADISGGQRQRLAIARALLLKPSILLLDDPTAAVDPQTEHDILHALDNAMKERTTLLVGSRVSTLRRANTILVFEKGQIVQRGSHNQLMAEDGPYRRAAELQLNEEPVVAA